jgi:hypothetical protein
MPFRLSIALSICLAFVLLRVLWGQTIHVGSKRRCTPPYPRLRREARSSLVPGNSNFTILGLPVPGNTDSAPGGASMILRFGQITGEYSFLHSSNEARQSAGLLF